VCLRRRHFILPRSSEPNRGKPRVNISPELAENGSVDKPVLRATFGKIQRYARNGKRKPRDHICVICVRGFIWFRNICLIRPCCYLLMFLDGCTAPAATLVDVLSDLSSSLHEHHIPLEQTLLQDRYKGPTISGKCAIVSFSGEHFTRDPRRQPGHTQFHPRTCTSKFLIPWR